MANIKPPEFGLEKHSHCVASMKALCSLMAYWKMTSNAPSLHYFLVGEKTSIKNEFFKIVFAYLFDKGINMSD